MPVVAAVAAAVVAAAALMVLGTWNYLLFHWLAEGFSILVAFGIFLIAWNSRQRMDSGYLLTMGVAFLFVGCLDFVHSMVFKSGNAQLFSGLGTDPPTQLWIAARSIQALSLLGAFALIRRRPSMGPLLAGYAAVCALTLLAIFQWKAFPSCLPDGGGLTAFKKVSEFVIVGVLGGALLMLRRNRDRFEGGVYRCVAWAIGISMASELAFVFYGEPASPANMVGHLLKVAAFYLFYRAIVQTGFRRPMNLLFRDLVEARDGLEAKVAERTAALARTVDALRGEVSARVQAEKRIRATTSLLEIFAHKTSRAEYLQAVVQLLRETSGCRCVGVRLRNDRGEAPYEACVGFSPEFQAREGRVCIGRDRCVCARVVEGSTVPSDAPALTAAGSFVTGDAPAFVAGLAEDERPNYRGVCAEMGFASLAVVPIRREGKTLGAVHLADERKGLASPDVVAFVEESLAPLIGEAVGRFNMEEAVRQGQQRLFSVLNLLPGFVALKGADRRIRFANHKFQELFSVPGERACHLVQHGRTSPCDDCHLERVLQTRQLAESERAYPNQRIYHVWSYPFLDGDGSELVLELGLDVTAQRQLENQVLEASEMERRRIGRDLHDSLGQKLAGVSFLLEGLLRGRAREGAREEPAAAQVMSVLKESVAEVRAITKGLDPVDLGGGGFLAGLEHLAAGAEEAYGVQCRVRCDEEAPLPDEATATHLYYIVQEAVANAARHGRARSIGILLQREDHGVTLCVKDDGTGIVPAGSERAGGMGLRIMRYRAGAAGGTLSVRADPRGGTVVRCHVPGRRVRREAEP